MLLRKFSWLYRCADWRCRDFFAAENIKDIKSFRAKKSDLTFRVTTQIVLDCEATCGPSVCGVYFNTNHTNLTNCAGVNLQLGKNSIRVRLERFVLKETRIELPPTWRCYPARLGRLERFVLKETTHTAVPHVGSHSGAT